MTAILFIATVLIWGSTWIAIKMQVGFSEVLTAVFWRFALAAVVTVLGMAALGRLRLPRMRELPWLAALGFCLFCANFVCFYHASRFVPSGLVSVLFATATLFNAVNARLIYGERITTRMILAGACGALGVLLLFRDELAHGLGAQGGLAVGLGLCGTLLFSLGNMISRRNSAAGMPVVWANAWGMSFGTAFLAVAVLASGSSFVPPADAAWLGAALYLAIIGSVAGFAAYLGLVARIGPSRAAYTTVIFPVVALTLSWLFEGYHWTPVAVLGLGLVMAGNVILFARAPARRARAVRAGLSGRGSG
ncbi:DMT family transporter [Paracoccus suum]|uniref:DMT family transporter n=1 Tax=Paracoccus suum TaxID=2259340 RepID=A0A344PJ43_9RHOB|nr:DMT family transporter [Paracoccus suum]AXC49398.1 DMT family transporter [Paracoccus suum]